jgi:hypothetical protein
MHREQESASSPPPFQALIILVENQQIVKTITQLISHGKPGVTGCQFFFSEKGFMSHFLGDLLRKSLASAKKYFPRRSQQNRRR